MCAPPRVLLSPRSDPPHRHWEETGNQKGETIFFSCFCGRSRGNDSGDKSSKGGGGSPGRSGGSWTPAPAASARSSLSSTAVT